MRTLALLIVSSAWAAPTPSSGAPMERVRVEIPSLSSEASVSASSEEPVARHGARLEVAGSNWAPRDPVLETSVGGVSTFTRLAPQFSLAWFSAPFRVLGPGELSWRLSVGFLPMIRKGTVSYVGIPRGAEETLNLFPVRAGVEWQTRFWKVSWLRPHVGLALAPVTGFAPRSVFGPGRGLAALPVEASAGVVAAVSSSVAFDVTGHASVQVAGDGDFGGAGVQGGLRFLMD